MNTLQVIYMLTQSPECEKVVIEEDMGYRSRMGAIEVLSGIGDRDWVYNYSRELGMIFIY